MDSPGIAVEENIVGEKCLSLASSQISSTTKLELGLDSVYM